MSTPARGRPRGVAMILPLLQIATVPNAAIPMPIVFRMADIQLCWAICVPRATIVLYRKIVARGTQIAQQSWTSAILKTIGIGIAAFGTVAICNNGKIIATPLGLPLAGVLMVLFFVLLTFLAKWTTFGRHVYAVGGSAEAARRAGINVPRVRVLVFALSGAMAAIGGIIFAAQVNSVALTFPPGNLLLNAIAAAVIGGVSLFGGRGEVRGALLGAILIGTLQNGLNTLSISNGWIYIVTGAVLLAAVTLDTVAVRLQARSGR